MIQTKINQLKEGIMIYQLKEYGLQSIISAQGLGFNHLTLIVLGKYPP